MQTIAHEYHLLMLPMHILDCFDIVASLPSPSCVLKPDSDPKRTSASLGRVLSQRFLAPEQLLA